MSARDLAFRAVRFAGIRLSKSRMLDDETAVRILYRSATGKTLDLGHPLTFNEKLQWLKLNDRQPCYVRMVDKIQAKEWAAAIIGDEYIVPTLRIWKDVKSIDLVGLPETVVLKTNHDSGTVIVANQEKDFRLDKVKQLLKRKMKKNFFYESREWPYKDIRPLVFAEAYIGTITENSITEPIDYKFMCFNGICRYIFTCTERGSGDLKVDFFDKNWNHQPFRRRYPNSQIVVERPGQLEKMIGLAEKLAKDIPFVRVDLYCVDDRIYFGEMTFYPGAGLEQFEPDEWDRALGDMLDLPKDLKGDNTSAS